MTRMRALLLASAFVALVLVPTVALAAPRSGGSFSGRGGFRSGGGSFSRGNRVPTQRGPNVVIFPGFGWGFLPFGMGGGAGLLGTVVLLGALGIGGAMLMRAMRRSPMRRDGGVGESRFGAFGGYDDDEDDDEQAVAAGRAFVTKVQLGLGRSARGIQERLERFAAEGDTSSEAGLAQLLSQTGLELLREKHSIRYVGLEVTGPLSLTNGETKLNALALAERSRFQVERVRGADGQVRRSTAAAVSHAEVLEYLLVTVLVASRTPFSGVKKVTEREELDTMLQDLGGVSQRSLLGLEVIWTPADPEDALTEADLLLHYPNLRSV